MSTQMTVQTPTAKPAFTPAAHGVLQRCTATQECDECRKKRLGTLQRAAVNSSPISDVPPLVHEVLRSPGQPLDAQTRAFMEPRFGHDFSGVRVYTDAKATKSAQAVNALAYTVGQNVVFGERQYAPQSNVGRRLIAHELTHTLQQQGSRVLQGPLTLSLTDDQFESEANSVAASVLRADHTSAEWALSTGSAQTLQRDLATPPPAVPAAAQPNLTPAQIQEAIAFNRARYDAANTRLIQDLLGGPVTGIWTAENIEAIAATQEEYGLTKDGKVGNATFRFLNREQRLEGMRTRVEDCLVSFRLVGPDAQNFGRDDPTHCHFRNHFRIEAQFSPRCNCDRFQYRQFIRGHWHRTRGGVVTDLPINEPGGVLPAAFIEDTDVTDPVPHYGHRDAAATVDPEDHYIDAAGADNQAHGCRYRSQDFVGFWPVGASFDDCLAGDRYDLFTTFRGEIQRDGHPIQPKFWTAINIANWHP